MHTSAKRIDVAKKAAVSGSTVSRALSNSPLIPERTKARIREIALSLGYVPNKQAALFAQRKTFRLGFVIPLYEHFPPFSRSYLPALLDGILPAVEQRGYSLTIIVERKDGKLKDLSRIVKSKEVDGLLLAITKTGDERIGLLKKDKIPFVIVNGFRKGCNCIDNNPLPGMRKAFEYLTGIGHKHVGYISGNILYNNAVDRLNAFHLLAGEFGIESTIKTGNFSLTSGYCCAGQLLQRKNRPSLIMTSSDREALGVLNYCRDHHVPVPEDVSIIGYDNLDPASIVTPALTTVDNPVTRIGKESTGLLIRYLEKKIKRPVSKKLDTGFIIRESSGKCKKH